MMNFGVTENLEFVITVKICEYQGINFTICNLIVII